MCFFYYIPALKDYKVYRETHAANPYRFGGKISKKYLIH